MHDSTGGGARCVVVIVGGGADELGRALEKRDEDAGALVVHHPKAGGHLVIKE